MFGSRIYAKSVSVISDQLVRVEVAIEFTGHHGRVTRESIFKTTREELKFIR